MAQSARTAAVLECKLSGDSLRARDNKAPHQAECVVTIDYEPDNEADSPRMINVVRDHEYMTKGKWGNKKTLAEIYREDKSYLQWVRRHVDGTSHQALRALKTYVEMRDHIV